MPYRVFISYSHAADGKLAPALQSALHRFVEPRYRLRAINVFRDETSMSITPALWPSVEKALSKSEYFILMASPEAAASNWVRKEVNYWLQHASQDKILIDLTRGKLFGTVRLAISIGLRPPLCRRRSKRALQTNPCIWTCAGPNRRKTYR
jgi:hypothetical protein